MLIRYANLLKQNHSCLVSFQFFFNELWEFLKTQVMKFGLIKNNAYHLHEMRGKCEISYLM